LVGIGALRAKLQKLQDLPLTANRLQRRRSEARQKFVLCATRKNRRFFETVQIPKVIKKNKVFFEDSSLLLCKGEVGGCAAYRA
jgi:hypothetical protein